jgi:hypothetical protein
LEGVVEEGVSDRGRAKEFGSEQGHGNADTVYAAHGAGGKVEDVVPAIWRRESVETEGVWRQLAIVDDKGPRVGSEEA